MPCLDNRGDEWMQCRGVTSTLYIKGKRLGPKGIQRKWSGNDVKLWAHGGLNVT